MTLPKLRILHLVMALLLFGGYTVDAHPPTGIVVDQKGNVFFTDLETVWKLNTTGELTVYRPGVSGRHVHELSIDKDDNVYGADNSYESQKWISDVWKMTADGSFSYLLSPTSNPPRGMGIWLDRTGNMFSVEQDNRAKTQTLLLRRTSDGNVMTLAGGPYGQRDGKGTSARFGSVGGMVFAPDGSLYLTDGTAVRRVTMDGVVTTIAKDLNKRTAEDRPLLFGRNNGILTGLSVNSEGDVYLADAGNQRLLKISRGGTVNVVYRGESPYYPNGVVATPAGDLYVLEVGFQAPSTWLRPRVRKINAAGQNVVVATVGEEQQIGGPGEQGGHEAESVKTNTSIGVSKYVVLLVSVVLVGLTFLVWKRKQRLGDA